MKILNQYHYRPIQFLELFIEKDITFKYYSISNRNSIAIDSNIKIVKQKAWDWYNAMHNQGFDTYSIAILIVHEVKEGVMGIISRWIDENMLQTYVYLFDEKTKEFELFSQNGITTCIWELQVLWFERNAWVEYVLLKGMQKDNIKEYLSQKFTQVI